MSAGPVTVRVLDTDYRIACAVDERAAWLDAAAYLDGRLREAHDRSQAGTDATAMRVALDLARELLQLKSREAKLQSEVQAQVRSLRERVEGVLAQGPRSPL